MNFTNKRILKHFQLNLDETRLCELPFADIIDALNEGKEQAAMLFTGINSQGLHELLITGNVRYINMDEQVDGGGNIHSLMIRYPFYRPFILPKNLHGGSPEEAINTIASSALLIARNDFSDDYAYDIAEIIFRNKVRISTQSNLSLALEDISKIDSLSIPVHEGALAFFERDKPSKLERYTGVITLIVTIVFGIGSLYWGIARTNTKNERKKLDFYIAEVQKRYEDYYIYSSSSSYQSQLKEWRKEIYKLKESSLAVLLSNEIKEDKRYIFLQGEINNLLLLAEKEKNIQNDNLFYRIKQFFH